jgi:hypothetical protein
MNGRWTVGALLVTFGLSLSHAASADDALVLPKGRSSGTLEHLFYLSTGERWNPNGNPEGIASNFDGRRLDSSVFTILQPLDAFVGGSASIGDSRLRFEYHYNISNVTLAHGLTDRLTVGVEIPYYHVRNDVTASVRSGPGTSANVGLRTGPGPGPLCGAAVAVLPLACPNTRRFTTEDVQQILGQGRPGIPGFGFKRIRDFRDDGLGDIQLGAKYQYWRSEDVRLAAGGGVRFPTGRQDDPNDLVDMSWSSGAYGLFARFQHDYILSNLWKEQPTPASEGVAAAGDVILNGSFRYEWVLPDEATLRVAEPNTLTTTRERLDRDLGDRFDFEVSAQYQLTSAFAFSLAYRYGFKLKDEFTSNRGLATGVLEEDTDSTEQVYIVRLTYSTLPLYRAGRFPLPVDIALSWRDRFAGSGPRSAGSPSQVLKTQYIGLHLRAIF